MKKQVLTRKNIVSVFTALLFIYGIHGVGYAELTFTEGDTTTREIEENTPAGTNIGVSLRYTREEVESCSSAILRGPDARAFDVERVFRGIQLKTKSALDYETKDSYEVKVTVSGGWFTDTIDVTINITDVEETQPNRAPVFASESTNRFVFENTATDQNIGTPVSATDPDGDILTYNLSGTDAASFNIDPLSGQLRTKVLLDYETKPQYMVTVEVSDGG